MSIDGKLNVLVTGATGRQGGAVASALLHAGHHVRALTRTPGSFPARRLARDGAEVVKGSFDDPDSCDRAMRGMDALFAMSTPFEQGPAAEVRQARTLIDAAAKADVSHVVYSSAASALENTGVPQFDSKIFVERHLRASRAPHTILCPVFFMENFRSAWVLPRLRFGELALPIPRNRRVQMVALDDLADVVVLALEHRQAFSGQRVEVASEEVRGWQAAKTLTEVLGRRVDYVEAPLPDHASRSELSPMLRWLARKGHSVNVARLHARLTSIGWRSLSDWASMLSWNHLTRSHELRRVSHLRLQRMAKRC